MNTPEALQKTTLCIEQKWDEIEAFLKDKKRFVFLGCGSSYSLARSMAVMTYMHTGVPTTVISAGDLLLHAPRYVNAVGEAAVICISRSGQTSEMNIALDAIKEFNPHIASLICADDTPLEARSELSINMPWAFDNSVCQTRTVTNFYFAAAYILAKYLNNPVLLQDLLHITDNCEEFLLKTEKITREIAEKPWNHSVILADAELEGIADNGSLAFKEICQLPSNYYHILDSRHEPMVLFNEYTLLLAALGPMDKLEFNYLKDMVKKKSLVVAFSDVPIEIPGVVSFSYGRKLSQIALGLPFIMFCQLITYYKAAHTGANPDQPSGLSAWISLSDES
jgi:fructoselysine-6-P-deglycase FrlB-like protein